MYIASTGYFLKFFAQKLFRRLRSTYIPTITYIIYTCLFIKGTQIRSNLLIYNTKFQGTFYLQGTKLYKI